MNKISVFLSRIALFVILVFTSNTFALGQAGELDWVFHQGVIVFFLFVFLILIVLVQFHNKESGLAKLFSVFNKQLTDAKPIEQEHTILLDHNYDGIMELDNNLPPWWKYLFYVTIVFSIIYMINYHVINIWPLSDQEYKDEIALAELQKANMAGAMINENTVTALTDIAALSAGKEIFVKYCAACHGQKGEGLVGPNLTDDYWIHGGGIKNIYRIVVNGVIEKGMLSWKAQLKPQQIQEVGSYILSLYGTNPPNAKAPQGEKWVDPANAPADTTKKAI